MTISLPPRRAPACRLCVTSRPCGVEREVAGPRQVHAAVVAADLEEAVAVDREVGRMLGLAEAAADEKSVSTSMIFTPPPMSFSERLPG